MKIKCKESKTFLCEINIEEYHTYLKKVGVDITKPITLKFACRKCKCEETYEIYPTHYACANKKFRG